MRELTVVSLLRACRRHAVLVALCIACGFAATVAAVCTLQPRYDATATLVLKTRVEHLSDMKSVTPDLMNAQSDLAIARTQTAILQNSQLARDVIEQLHLDDLPEFRPRAGLTSRLVSAIAPASRRKGPAEDVMAAAVEAYQRRLAVFNDGRSYVFTVSFEAGDAELAAKIANAHASLYLVRQREQKQDAERIAAAWISREVARLRDEVEASEQAIHQFREQSSLMTAGGNTAVQHQVAEISQQLAQAEADLAARRAHVSEAQAALGQDAAGDQSRAIDDLLVEKLRERDADAHAALSSLLPRSGPSNPAVVEAQARVTELDARIDQELRRITHATGSDVRIAADRVAVLSATLARLQGQLGAEDAASSQLSQMEHDLEATRSVYQMLRGRQAEIEAQLGSETPDSQLVAAATPPPRPAFPNVPLLLALGMSASTVAAVTLAWWLSGPGHAPEEPLQLERALGLTVLQSIALVSGKAPRLADKVLAEPRSQFADSIRALQGSVARKLAGAPTCAVAVTSAAIAEGKTTLAVSLARSMAASGLRVLLIDCDLRRPKAAATLGLASAGPGLVAALRDRCPLEHAVKDDPLSSLQALCPEELVDVPQNLLGDDFSDLLRRARLTYDFIVVDTAPIGLVSEAAQVAQKVDGVLVAVRWRRTPLPVVSMALQELERCGATVLGCVLNALDEKVLAKSNPHLAELQRIKRSYFAHD